MNIDGKSHRLLAICKQQILTPKVWEVIELIIAKSRQRTTATILEMRCAFSAGGIANRTWDYCQLKLPSPRTKPNS